MAQPANKNILTLIIVLIVIAAAYAILTMPDQRTGTQKLGDAIHDLDKGPKAAARQLQDRTPGQRIGDSVKDAGDNIKRDTAPSQ